MKLKTIIRHIFHKPYAIVKNNYPERIESLPIDVPALHVGILEYAPGQLKTNSKKLEGKTVKLYYPPEAVSDAKFLKSLEVAPLTVGGHDSTTNEQNKKIDGWTRVAIYDENEKGAIIRGVIKGNKEIAYIKSHLKPNSDKDKNDFGASAFLDMKIIEKSGITPEGEEYNAIAKDLMATHVTLSEYVRDPYNKVEVINSVVVNSKVEFNKNENNNSEEKRMDITAEQITALVKNAVSEILTAKNAEDRTKELEDEVKNLKEELKNCGFGKKNAKNAETEEEEKKKKEEEAKNAEEEEKKKEAEEEKDSTLENAKPSQALVAAVANSLNIDFGTKTPSFNSIAGMLGIKEADPALRIAAVNAKYSELIAKAKISGSAENTTAGMEVF